jgi:DNA-binding NarL/FixJ family response regulator
MGLKGESHPNSKLNSEDVIKIRTLASHGFSLKVIARNYKISVWNVKSIIHKKTWKHL